MASSIRGSYDSDLQMYRKDPIPNMNMLRYWRWQAEQWGKTHGPAELTFDYSGDDAPLKTGPKEAVSDQRHRGLYYYK